MGDLRLRGLERRWRKTADPRDEATYLAERVRVGDLSPARLRLAAYAGGAGAALALGSQGPTAPEGLTAWVDGLVAWGKEALLRAGIAATWAVLPAWEALYPEDPSPRAVLLACCAWVLCPCERHRLAVTSARRAVRRDVEPVRGAYAELFSEVLFDHHDDELFSEALDAFFFQAVDVVPGHGKVRYVAWAAQATAAAVWLETGTRAFAARATGLAEEATPAAGAVRTAARHELARWALGLADDVRSRVGEPS